VEDAVDSLAYRLSFDPKGYYSEIGFVVGNHSPRF
jgi:hypothetical protein